MLKKLSSIFFLSLLLLLHYSKAITYLHCQIENMIITGATTCDCEKQMADNNDINQTNTAQKTTFKEKANENIFTLNNFFSRKEQKSISTCTFALNNISQISAGFHPNIFQPPKI